MSVWYKYSGGNRPFKKQKQEEEQEEEEENIIQIHM